MSIAQRSSTLAAVRATVFLGCWLIGLAGFPLAGAENFQSAPIDDRGGATNIESWTADLDLQDLPQVMAILFGTIVDTPDLQAEPMVLSPSLTDVATDGLVSPKPIALNAEGVNLERPTSAAAPTDMSVSNAAPADRHSSETPVLLASVPAAENRGGASLSDTPAPRLEMRTLGSLFTSDPLKQDLQSVVRPLETPSECPSPEICIDDYLWGLYERTPKIDTNKVVERFEVQANVTIKKKNKSVIATKTLIKRITKYVVGDFAWKDPVAAQFAGMSLKDYVIGGMDPDFKLKLYRAVRAMEDAGHMPGITSAFRDDYRQSIASGTKAASDSSYHGGSRRGGYGSGLAADLVSIKGDTRIQRYASSQDLWKWIDAHEKELGIGRPYLDRDPPHVGPLDGAEYAAKRGRMIAQKTRTQTEERHVQVSLSKGAQLAKLKVSSQPPSKARERASKNQELQAKDHLASLMKDAKLAKLKVSSSLQPQNQERASNNEELQAKGRLAERNSPSSSKRVKLAKPSAVSSVQPVPRPPKRLARAAL